MKTEYYYNFGTKHHIVNDNGRIETFKTKKKALEYKQKIDNQYNILNPIKNEK